MMARIYKPARNAMQSGQAKSRSWVLVFEPQQAKELDPLMGYTATRDMRQQIRLSFESLDAAENYAKANGWPYRVAQAKTPVRQKVSYAENFRFRP